MSHLSSYIKKGQVDWVISLQLLTGYTFVTVPAEEVHHLSAIEVCWRSGFSRCPLKVCCPWRCVVSAKGPRGVLSLSTAELPLCGRVTGSWSFLDAQGQWGILWGDCQSLTLEFLTRRWLNLIYLCFSIFAVYTLLFTWITRVTGETNLFPGNRKATKVRFPLKGGKSLFR